MAGTMIDLTVIYTHEDGRPIPRPERGGSATLAEYFGALHAYEIEIRSAANRAFDDQFRKSLRASGGA